ncbi:MAG: hypothetical protein GY913_33600 [Proteobacteria bacterium]|nr:hypothetical protein [Pseudomonadota bacterium]MCP4921863.1 hypothetical protein [Pseudomonadota bacterium]
MLLIPSAWAYTIVMPCQIHLASIAPNAVDVPIDHVPAMVVDGECDDTLLEMELFLGDESVASASERITGPGLIELDVELQPETTYTWHAGGLIIEFTTGTELAELSEAPPIASELMVKVMDSHTIVRVDVDVEDDGIWILELLDDEGTPWLIDGRGGAGEHSLVSQHDLQASGELCLTPSLRREDGSRVEGEPLCDARAGCSATGLGASLLPGLLAIGALRRRRRA